jgi:hypothetical protein
VRVRDTDFSFKHKRKEGKKEFPYGDPCPASMRSVRLEDLAAVDISWRMLTMLRPKNRLEEDIFSRLVELGKLRLGTRNWEAKQLASAASGAPGSQSNAIMLSMGIVVVKSKRGGVETRIKTCKECGLELCPGILCRGIKNHIIEFWLEVCYLAEFPYDSYTRMLVDKDDIEKEDGKGAARRASKGKGHPPPGKGIKVAKASPSAGGKGLRLRKKKKRKKKKPKKTGSSSSNSDEEE